jgi:dGTPase
LGLLERPAEQYCWARHPLAFVTEAADDICYRIVDLEDAYNQKLIPYYEIEKILEELLTGKQIDRVRGEDPSDRVAVIRALVIGEAIKATVDAFEVNYEGIMDGSFDDDLITKTKLYGGFRAIKALQEELVYRNDRVLKIEVAGFSVIRGLLDHFVRAANDFIGAERTRTVLNSKIINLIPTQFFADNKGPSPDPYFRLLEIVDFVSGMTDSYALSLFRSLTGIQVP